MKWKLLLAALLLFAGASELDAAERVSATLDLTNVTVEVYWMQSEEAIADVRASYEGDFMLDRAAGFSVLKRNLETGELTCAIYVLKPRMVNDRRTTALGHELLHCLAGAYHD